MSVSENEEHDTKNYDNGLSDIQATGTVTYRDSSYPQQSVSSRTGNDIAATAYVENRHVPIYEAHTPPYGPAPTFVTTEPPAPGYGQIHSHWQLTPYPARYQNHHYTGGRQHQERCPTVS